MRHFVITKVQVWEVEVPDISDAEAELELALHTEPDYETVDAEEV